MVTQCGRPQTSHTGKKIISRVSLTEFILVIRDMCTPLKILQHRRVEDRFEEFGNESEQKCGSVEGLERSPFLENGWTRPCVYEAGNVLEVIRRRKSEPRHVQAQVHTLTALEGTYYLGCYLHLQYECFLYFLNSAIYTVVWQKIIVCGKVCWVVTIVLHGPALHYIYIYIYPPVNLSIKSATSSYEFVIFRASVYHQCASVAGFVDFLFLYSAFYLCVEPVSLL